MRVALVLVIGVLLVTRLLPVLVRGVGAVLAKAWTPMLELLTFPEYLTTSICRRHGWPLVPGTYGFGRLLGAAAKGGTAVGTWLGARFTVRPKFPVKTTVLAVAVLASCWYVEPSVPPGGLKTTLTAWNADVVRVDGWLRTGNWGSPAAGPACPTAKAPAKPRPAATPAPKTKTKPNPATTRTTTRK